jgi:putative transcriptional regulator
MTNHVRELRTEARWSQGELAVRLGVSRQTVHAIETGKYDPSLPLAFRIAALFERAIEDVFVPDSPPPHRAKGGARGKEQR